MAAILSYFGIMFIILPDLFLAAFSQQCYEYTCTGSGCLETEVTSNPLLIKKCDRIIYRGCYTITTSTNGFFTTSTGCIERGFECKAGTCSGLTVRTEVTCCNTDLCNDETQASASTRMQYSKWLQTVLLWLCIVNAFNHSK